MSRRLSPLPWTYENNWIRDAEGRPVAVTDSAPYSLVDAARIAGCVNACAAFPEPWKVHELVQFARLVGRGELREEAAEVIARGILSELGIELETPGTGGGA